jgi:hypothetical protein
MEGLGERDGMGVVWMYTGTLRVQCCNVGRVEQGVRESGARQGGGASEMGE